MSLRSGIGSGSGHSKLQSHLDSAASPIFLQALQPQQQQHSTFYRVPELNMMGLIDSSAVDTCAAAAATAGDTTRTASGTGTVLKLKLSHADQVELDLNMMLNQQAVAAAAAAAGATPSYWPAPQGQQHQHPHPHPQHHLILPQESLGCLYTSAAAAASAASAAAAACMPPSSGSASDCGNGNGSSSLVFPLAPYCNRAALDGGGHGEATMFPYKHQQEGHGLQQDAACAASGSSSSSYLHYNHLPYKTSSAATNSPQLQALRDFMSYGSSLQQQQQQQQPSCSSPGPGPGPGAPRLRGLNSATLFLQLGEEQDCHSQLEQEAAERELQNQATTAPSQDAMASYRALCQAEMLAAAAANAGAQLERSPHRSQFQRENHIMAERQRREEMNEKFTALRSMIPKATKKDKASIVGDTINYVLELERTLKHLQACKAARKGPLPLPMLSSAAKKTTSNPSNPAFPNEQQQPQAEAEADSLDQANVTMCAAGSDHDTVVPYHQHQGSLAGPHHQAASAAAAAAEEPAQVEVQKLRDQAVIKIICSRSPGLVFRILHALDECKVDLLQGNVTTVDDNTVHYITVQLVAGSSASTEDLVVALQNASSAIG